MSIGSRIKERRKALNLTQTSLAEKLHITKGAIANYENSVSIPKPDVMLKLFNVLECDANYLYQDDIEIVISSENKTDIGIELYNQLDDNDKAEIRGEMKQMLKAEKYNDIQKELQNA